MTDYPTEDQKRIAHEHYHDAFYLGRDGRGCDHWWSIYHQAVVRFDPDGDVATLEFPAEKFLPEYIATVRAEHDGWTDGPRYDETGADFVDEVLA